VNEVTLDEVSAWLVSLVVPLGAILGILAAVARWVWPRVRRSLIGEVGSHLDEALEPILTEVRPNHGSSMKDHLDQLNRQVAEMDRKLVSLHNRVDNLRDLPDRVSDLALRLDAHIDRGPPRRRRKDPTP
jgi:hypothetical protein